MVTEVCPFASTRSPSAPFESMGIAYEHDVVIDHGQVRKRKKKASKKFRRPIRAYSASQAEEPSPWTCRRLVIGTGTGGPPGDG